MASPRTAPRPARLAAGGVPEHFNLPWKLALEGGAFTRAGLDLTWTDEPSGTGAIVAALADGRLDVATVLTEGIVAAIDAGLAAHIEQVYVASPLRWGVHVPRGRGDLRVGALPHRRIAISRLGSGSHLMARVLADREGWRLDDVEYVPVTNLEGGVRALETGAADLFLWETFMTKPHVDLGRCDRAGELPTPWPGFVVARRSGVPVDLVRTAMAVVDAEVRSFVARPDRAALVADRLGLAEPDAAAWFERTTYAHGERLRPAQLAQVRAALAR
jgi:sulfonate transport system substrate-binding protein